MDSTDRTEAHTAAEMARKAQTNATNGHNDDSTKDHRSKDKEDNLGKKIIKATIGKLHLKKHKKKDKKGSDGSTGSGTDESEDDQVHNGDSLLDQEEKRLTDVETEGNFFAGDGFAMKKEEHVDKPGETEVKKEKRVKKLGETEVKREEHVDKDGRKEVKKEKHMERPGDTEVKKPEDLKAKTKHVDEEGAKNVEKSYADVGAHALEAEKDTKGKGAIDEKESKYKDKHATPEKTVETDIHESTQMEDPKHQHERKGHSDADKKKDAKIDDQDPLEAIMAGKSGGEKGLKKKFHTDDQDTHEDETKIDREMKGEIKEVSHRSRTSSSSSEEGSHVSPPSSPKEKRSKESESKNANDDKPALKKTDQVDETVGDQYAEKNIEDMNAKYEHLKQKKHPRRQSSSDDYKADRHGHEDSHTDHHVVHNKVNEFFRQHTHEDHLGQDIEDDLQEVDETSRTSGKESTEDDESNQKSRKSHGSAEDSEEEKEKKKNDPPSLPMTKEEIEEEKDRVAGIIQKIGMSVDAEFPEDIEEKPSNAPEKETRDQKVQTEEMAPHSTAETDVQQSGRSEHPESDQLPNRPERPEPDQVTTSPSQELQHRPESRSAATTQKMQEDIRTKVFGSPESMTVKDQHHGEAIPEKTSHPQTEPAASAKEADRDFRPHNNDQILKIPRPREDASDDEFRTPPQTRKEVKPAPYEATERKMDEVDRNDDSGRSHNREPHDSRMEGSKIVAKEETTVEKPMKEENYTSPHSSHKETSHTPGPNESHKDETTVEKPMKEETPTSPHSNHKETSHSSPAQGPIKENQTDVTSFHASSKEKHTENSSSSTFAPSAASESSYGKEDGENGNSALKKTDQVDETLSDQYAEKNIQDMNAKYEHLKQKNEAQRQSSNDSHNDRQDNEKRRVVQHKVDAHHEHSDQNGDQESTKKEERMEEISRRDASGAGELHEKMKTVVNHEMGDHNEDDKENKPHDTPKKKMIETNAQTEGTKL